MKQLPLLLVVFVVVSLSACGSQASVQPALATVVPLATATLIRLTPAQPTPTLPLGTPTIPPEARLKIQCLDVASIFPPQAASEGVIILMSYTYPHPETILLDLATGSKTELSQQDESWQMVGVSPDRTKMAYALGRWDEKSGAVTREELVVAAANGQVQKSIPWEKGWSDWSPGWLDNDRLIIDLALNDPDESAARKPVTFLMLNPYTGERRVLQPNYPDIMAEYPVFHWGRWSETVYDPALTRVVYPSSRDGVVLWDMESHRALANVANYFLNPPVWSPDGSRFVLTKNFTYSQEPESWGDELFTVSRDGQQVLPVTSLTAYYPYAAMWQYTWSPDGNRIAFWLVTDREAFAGDDYTYERLAVLDLPRQEVTEYCIPLDPWGKDHRALLPVPSSIWVSGDTTPLWSPNSQQLVVESRYAKDASRVILIDVVWDFAVQIADTMHPEGWMATK